MFVQANGMSIKVEDSGDTNDTNRPVVLLIMGLGMQLTSWPPALVDGLIHAGYRVVRFDNRDIGLSSHLDHLGKPRVAVAVVKRRMGLPVHAPYTLSDMARDAVGVLDALNIRKAHVVGVSMGGMIAQRVALQAPQRLLSLTSIMSSSGARGLPGPHPRVGLMMVNRPTESGREAMIEHGLKLFQLIGSPDHIDPEPVLRARIAFGLDRSFHPAGTLRQMVAIIADSDRANHLHKISTPTLVIHGKKDPLVPFACGADTAKRIPHAKLLPIPGMGHDLPASLLPTLLDAMHHHFELAALKQR